MKDSPLISTQLARQIEAAHIEFVVERLQGIVEQAGNPFRADISRYGSCVALSAGLPPAWMNTIHILGKADLEWVRSRIEQYRALKRPVRVEIIPSDITPSLANLLAELGLIQQEFHASLYGTARHASISDLEGIQVEPVNAKSFDIFLDTFLAGFEAPPISKGNMSHWIDQPSWLLYLCWVNKIPVAAGVMSRHKKTAYLAAGATIPAFRGQGLQSALIARRIADAAESGCEIMTGQCRFASTSHRNMQRAGLQLAYTKAIWT